MLGGSCSCLFFNPILRAEQASIYPLGGDLGPMRLTLDGAALDSGPDYMRDQRSVAAEGYGGQKLTLCF